MKIQILAFLPELLKHLFRKTATVDYPFQKLVAPEGFRGTPVLYPEKCIVCKACVRDCPAEALEIVSVSETEKKFKMTIHNDRCVHCAQCVDSCPTDAMGMNKEFELAVFDRHNLKIEYVYVKSTPAPRTTPTPNTPKT
ncbi:MAG: NADH-quinone oxidoreductase subunit I [bacterium]|nr:NADH-quinone oxidoreductase subunit I [bacterium]